MFAWTCSLYAEGTRDKAYNVSSVSHDSGSKIEGGGEMAEAACLQIQDRRDRKLNVQNKGPKGFICMAELHCVRTL